jgi:hypothetical protein
MVNRPMPALHKYWADKLPSPPTPATRTLAAFSLCWPFGPISGKMVWRKYRFAISLVFFTLYV